MSSFRPASSWRGSGRPGPRLRTDSTPSDFAACVAEANPAADIVWRKRGQSSIFSLGEFLKFEPVAKSDSGTYICLARNSIGASDEISAELDVKYPPRNIITDPQNVLGINT